MRIFFLLLVALFFLSIPFSKAQRGRDKTVVYEELYDEPYDLNKLWILFQPVYGELFVSNLTLGYGLEAQYMWDDKAEFRIAGRTAYAIATDFERDIAENNVFQINDTRPFTYYEVGGTYHIKDFEGEAETKMILLRSKENLNKLKASVPDQIKIPSKKRTIYGARLGALAYNTTTDIDRVIRDDNLVITTTSLEGNEIPLDPNQELFTNVNTVGIYLGGQYTKIKNFAVKPDKTFGTLVNDLIFTTYLDLIFAPTVDLDDVEIRADFDNDGIPDDAGEILTYNLDEISTSSIGFRAGMEGKFNREWSWAYNAEVGVRPGVSSRGFYFLLKLSFPVYSTQLKNTQEAFGK
ncbi:MAG: hypothetical protein AAF363_15265 [Bacteroidota bacterium]